MRRYRIVLVGLGNIGMKLLKSLPREFEIVCVEADHGRYEEARLIRDDINFIAGDATSRLVLEEAGIDDADIVIVTTTTEKVNLEVVRVIKEHFTPTRVISVGITREGIETLKGLGAEVEDIFGASALGIRNKIEQRSRTTHSIGLGKGEILEVEVHPNSKLANKTIGSLCPMRWNIGLIYRDGNIILPGKDVALKPKDRVIILGEPGAIKTVSEILTFNFKRFPLEYGSTALTYLTGHEDEVFFEEVGYLLTVLPLKKLIFVYSNRAAEDRERLAGLIKSLNFKGIEESDTVVSSVSSIKEILLKHKWEYGLIILSKDIFYSRFLTKHLDIWKKRFVQETSSLAMCPILFVSGTSPYEKVVTPCIEGIDVEHALEAVFEISSSLRSEVTALLVSPSKYIASDEDIARFEGMRKTVLDMSLIYKTGINISILEGNPIKAISATLSDYNLLIINGGSWRTQHILSSILNPDVVWNVIKKSPASVLIIPPAEESL